MSNPESNPYAAPTAAIAESSVAAPPLWNPKAAALWSLLFSPAFGAWLQMRNWQVMGEEEKSRQSWGWFLATLVLTPLAVMLAIWLPDSNPISKITNRFGVIMLIAWYVANGRIQIAAVKERFGQDYPRRAWSLPLLVGFGATIGLLIVAVAVAMFMAPGP